MFTLRKIIKRYFMECRTTHLFYFSPTHTSKSVGKAIIEGLGIIENIETDLTYCEPKEKMVMTDALAVIVVPVYGGRVAEVALERLYNLKGENTPVIPVVVYGNRDYDDALRELCDWCREHGFIPVAGAAFIGEHSYSRPGRGIAEGRPDEADLLQAKTFGADVRLLLDRNSSVLAIGELVVKGNYPYKEKGPKTPQTPLTVEDLCSGCGRCIDVCPVHTVRWEDRRIVSGAKACIKCCACVKECPHGARVFDTPYTDRLHQNFSEPKKPEFFFV